MKAKKIILLSALAFAVILLILINLSVLNSALRLNHTGTGSINGNYAKNGNYANIPEKCRPPAGQDIKAWKEHLGHHAETRDCLDYFK